MLKIHLLHNNKLMNKAQKYVFLYKLTLVLLILFLHISHVSAQGKIGVEQQSMLTQYENLLTKYRSDQNKRQEAFYLNKIGYLYWENEVYAKAIDYFKESLEINNQLNNQNAVSQLSVFIANLYSDLEDYNKSMEYLQKALTIERAKSNKPRIAEILNNMATVATNLKQYQQAISYAREALPIALEVDNLSLIRSCYGVLAGNYEALGDLKSAMENKELFRTFDMYIKQKEIEKIEESQRKTEAEKRANQLELEKKSLVLQLTTDSLGELEQVRLQQNMKIQLLEQQKLIDLKNQELVQRDAQLRTERIVRIVFIVGFILVIIFSLLVYRQYVAKKRANLRLAEQNEILEQQKNTIKLQSFEIEKSFKELAIKNKQITDSIQYARRIQEAILPSRKAIRENLPDSFIFYRPRDIVSGDFYWFSKQGQKLFLAAVDCTGHSVPGAFMSMIGNTLLNEIVNEKQIYEPARILEKLNAGVIYALKQETGGIETQDDGMDITLYCIDKENCEIHVACAIHTSFLVANDELKLIEGDIYSIGGGTFSSNRTEKSFTDHTYRFKDKTSIYLFSDGYPDQFGGPDNKKFMGSQFRQLILDYNHLPMHEQLEIFETKFDEWKGENKQTDDVLVIGIAINFNEDDDFNINEE